MSTTRAAGEGPGNNVGGAHVHLSWPQKAGLAVRAWWTLAFVLFLLRTGDLRTAVQRLDRVPRRRRASTVQHPPRRLSRAVSRSLRVGPWQPRCLIRSMVLYRLAREQGEPVELVIGLAHQAASTDAHAWVELAGRDIGPAPGRLGHGELIRYPLAALDHVGEG